MSSLYVKTIEGQLFLVGEINARKCKNINRMCTELYEVFRWPSNMNCSDAMYDLNWHEEKNYKIIVNKFNTLKVENQKELILKELNSYKDYWDKKRIREDKDDENHFVIELK